MEHPTIPPVAERYASFLQLAQSYFSEQSVTMIREALELADRKLDGRTRYDGSPLLGHSVGVARIVIAEIGLGRNSTISTLLHDVVRLGLMELKEVGERFGESCVDIIDGLCNISDVHPKVSERQAENFRDLIVSYSTDPRVILIKLADRLEVMRSLSIFPEEKRAKKSWESLHLYGEIAHKLGLYSLKSELEDIALSYLEPVLYREIAEKLEASASERTEFIERFLAPIREKLDQAGIKYQVKSRTKSIYSIWSKMRKMHISFEEIYDIFALRIIIDCPKEQEKTQCWSVYSVVTDFYTPNPDRMRDWISIPKSNGYESLHTTVVTPEGRWVEIQIRSERMDAVAERGIAAHWRYKGVHRGGMGSEEWLARLRDLMENTDSGLVHRKFDTKIESGEIFVFTPNGDLRKLRKGATVLDFAFDIHTSLGATCTGGRVNHRNVSIREKLKNGDIVEILTSKNQKPKADWLSIVVTSKARNKIKAYMREEQAKAASLGREELERKIKNWKLAITLDDAVTVLCKYYKVRTGTELYGKIADGTIDIADTKEIINRYLAGEAVQPRPRAGGGAAAAAKEGGQGDDALVIDDTLSNVEYKLGKCCNPILGDEVFGFITVASGITIHRIDCPNAVRLRERYPYRVLDARWRRDAVQGTAFRVSLRVTAEDHPGVVNRITEVINQDLKLNIRSMNLTSSGVTLTGIVNVEVTSTGVVDTVIHRLMRIKEVQRVYRVNN